MRTFSYYLFQAGEHEELLRFRADPVPIYDVVTSRSIGGKWVDSRPWGRVHHPSLFSSVSYNLVPVSLEATAFILFEATTK